MSLYFSEIGKLQVGICYFYTFFLIIETFSIRQNYCKLLVAGAGTLDPGVSATDDSIGCEARWNQGWRRSMAPDAVSAVETILINIVTSQCIRSWVGTCILTPLNLKISWLLGRNYETDRRRK